MKSNIQDIMKKTFLLKLLVVVVAATSLSVWQGNACTTGVMSGKFTKSGRPIIWKVRDTEHYKNAVKRYTDGPIEYVGLINASDVNGDQIWGGHNEAGFAIMNSASFNVNADYDGDWDDREGHLMHEALKVCKTLADFENYLNKRPKPMGVAAHFGVLDAQGGCAFYEVNNDTWTKFDANDPEVAPEGYVLRTNYSATGTEGVGYGYVRRASAEHLFRQIPVGALTIETVMQDLSRSTYHDVLKVDYRAAYSMLPPNEEFVATDDMICRYGTASTVTIEGVLEGEDPANTISWIQVGQPFVSITLPVFTGVEVPEVLAPKAPGKECPLGEVTMQLKERVYPLWKQADGHHYLQIGQLYNNRGTGITQSIEAVEDVIFKDVETARAEWMKGADSKAGKEAIYEKAQKATLKLYDEVLTTPIKL